ncbi:MAG TPA: DUF3343 domain-containing protein [Spirochaetota bacterium]|nr:DUF3343 domain-containing protein [Spirochaetota bacterium]
MLFQSVSHALRSEKILKKANIPFKLIPVPKSISSDCGVCIRFTPEHSEKIISTLTGNVEYSEIRQL